MAKDLRDETIQREFLSGDSEHELCGILLNWVVASFEQEVEIAKERPECPSCVNLARQRDEAEAAVGKIEAANARLRDEIDSLRGQLAAERADNSRLSAEVDRLALAAVAPTAGIDHAMAAKVEAANLAFDMPPVRVEIDEADELEQELVAEIGHAATVSGPEVRSAETQIVPEPSPDSPASLRAGATPAGEVAAGECHGGSTSPKQPSKTEERCAQIVEALKAGCKTQRQIAEHVGFSQGFVSLLLPELIEKGIARMSKERNRSSQAPAEYALVSLRVPEPSPKQPTISAEIVSRVRDLWTAGHNADDILPKVSRFGVTKDKIAEITRDLPGQQPNLDPPRRDDEPEEFAVLTNTNRALLFRYHREGKSPGQMTPGIQCKLKADGVRRFLRFYGCEVPDPQPHRFAKKPVDDQVLRAAIESSDPPKGGLPRNFLALSAAEKTGALRMILESPESVGSEYGLSLPDQELVKLAFPQVCKHAPNLQTPAAIDAYWNWVRTSLMTKVAA